MAGSRVFSTRSGSIVAPLMLLGVLVFPGLAPADQPIWQMPVDAVPDQIRGIVVENSPRLSEPTLLVSKGKQVVRIALNGKTEVVAGNGNSCQDAHDTCGDGGTAPEAKLNQPSALALRENGELLIVDGAARRVRAVSPEGLIRTVAGNGEYGEGVDGQPAAKVPLSHIHGVMPLPDGGFLIGVGPLVRRVGPTGVISTVMGSGTEEATFEPMPVERVALKQVRNVSPTRDGGFLVADWGSQVLRVAPDWKTAKVVAGTGYDDFAKRESGPAEETEIGKPVAAVEAPDGTILIVAAEEQVGPPTSYWHTEKAWGTVQRVSRGEVTTVVGRKTLSNGRLFNGGPVRDFNVPLSGIALSPDGGLFLSWFINSGSGGVLYVGPHKSDAKLMDTIEKADRDGTLAHLRTTLKKIEALPSRKSDEGGVSYLESFKLLEGSSLGTLTKDVLRFVIDGYARQNERMYESVLRLRAKMAGRYVETLLLR